MCRERAGISLSSAKPRWLAIALLTTSFWPPPSRATQVVPTATDHPVKLRECGSESPRPPEINGQTIEPELFESLMAGEVALRQKLMHVQALPQDMLRDLGCSIARKVAALGLLEAEALRRGVTVKPEPPILNTLGHHQWDPADIELRLARTRLASRLWNYQTALEQITFKNDIDQDVIQRQLDAVPATEEEHFSIRTIVLKKGATTLRCSRCPG